MPRLLDLRKGDIPIVEVGPSILDYQRDYETLRGRFIRIGGLVIVAPAIEVRSLEVHHLELLEAFKQNAQQRERINTEAHLSTAAEEPLLIGGDRRATLLNDAGFFNIFPRNDFDNEPHLHPVDIVGASREVGRAPNPEGRERTRVIFEQALGDTALVEALELPE